jgi:O-methyltransferase
MRQSLRTSLVKLLDKTGLGAPARAAKASGWLPWIPLVPRSDFYAASVRALRTLRSRDRTGHIGDYIEFGVSRGTSMSCMYDALTSEGLPRVRLFGFDSFEGLPAEAASEQWRPGAFKSTLSATRSYLTKAGIDWSRTTLVKGWFKHTLTPATRDRLGIQKASVIMIDCDIETASRDALQFAGPLIRDCAVVFLDDWDSDPRGGQRLAFEHFLSENPQFSVESLPTYTATARVFLLTRAAL